MTPQKILAQGAEAKIILSDNFIIKDRIKKSYRIPELDKKIRERRTRAEAKLLIKASKVINVPKVIRINEITKELIIEFIEGKKLSEHLDKFPLEKQKQILRQIGKDIARLHKEKIIHGDLTTSNMILVEDKTPNFNKLLNELKKLNLPKEEYVIFGSAPLAIRELRDNRDLDLLVSKKLFNKFKKKKDWRLRKFEQNGEKLERLEKGKIEMMRNLKPQKWNEKEIIENPEIIQGLSFINIKNFIKLKKKFAREKDFRDIKLIQDYLKNKNKPTIYFIDFGLGYFNGKHEDKAVDIHLLKQALEARHFKKWKKLFQEFEKGYKSQNKEQAEKVFERLKKVEKRGRYKH
jgi:tRNA A-37 threonylcarbamoyl transferase component Bud32